MENLFIDILGCSIETILLYYFYTKVLGPAKKNNLLVFIIYLLVGVYMFTLSSLPLTPQLRTLCAVMPSFAPIILYAQNWKVKILYAMVYLSIQVMSESFTKALALLFATVFSLQINYTTGVLISKMVAFLAIIFFTTILHVKNIKLPHYLTFSLLLIPFFSLMLIYELREVFYFLDTPSAYLKYLLTIILLIASNFILFYLFEKNTELHSLKIKMLLQDTLLKEQKNYYENALTMYNSNRQLSHDFKNHLLLIDDYIRRGNLQEALTYISDLTAVSNSYSITFSGCQEVDAILTAKQNLAKKQSTLFDILELSIPYNLHITKEFAMILATSLDNALEATNKIANQSKRWIHILIRHDDTYLYLQIENSTADLVEIHNNTIASTKADKEKHGLGLISVQEIAASLNGKVKLFYQDNTFSITVMLKYKIDNSSN